MTMILPHIHLRNPYRIPKDLASLVVARDRVCIYCQNDFAPIGPKGNRRASWEHIINDVNLITLENIAVCCTGCNSSKGVKNLRAWLLSPYCTMNSINAHKLAPVALAALQFQIRSDSETHNHGNLVVQKSIIFGSSQNTQAEPPENAA